MPAPHHLLGSASEAPSAEPTCPSPFTVNDLSSQGPTEQFTGYHRDSSVPHVTACRATVIRCFLPFTACVRDSRHLGCNLEQLVTSVGIRGRRCAILRALRSQLQSADRRWRRGALDTGAEEDRGVIAWNTGYDQTRDERGLNRDRWGRLQSNPSTGCCGSFLKDLESQRLNAGTRIEALLSIASSANALNRTAVVRFESGSCLLADCISLIGGESEDHHATIALRL